MRFSSSSPRYLALVHFLLNEISPLLMTWLALLILLIGSMTGASTTGVEYCDRLNDCIDEQNQQSAWQPGLQKICALPHEALASGSRIFYSKSFPAIANYIALVSLLGCYLLLVGIFLRSLPVSSPINGRYVAFVVSLKRSSGLAYFVRLNVALILALSLYGCSLLDDAQEIFEVLLGACLSVYALWSLTTDNRKELNGLDLKSPEFSCLLFMVDWPVFLFGYDCLSIKMSLDYGETSIIAGVDESQAIKQPLIGTTRNLQQQANA